MPDAGLDWTNTCLGKPMAACSSRANVRKPIVAPVIVGAIASATGTNGGACAFIPVLAWLSMAWLRTKLGRARDASVVTAVAVFCGHFAWILAGALFLGSRDTVPDLLIMVVLMLWLWFHPDRWSASAMLIRSMFTLARTVIDLNRHSFGVTAHRALVTHMNLRRAVTVPLIGTWRHNRFGTRSSATLRR